MKSFRFRLQAVLDQRERQEQVAVRDLAEAEHALTQAKALLTELKDIRIAITEEIGRQRVAAFDPQENQLYQDYLQTVAQSIRDQEERIDQLALARDGRRTHVVAASRNRQVIDSVKVKARQEFTQQAQRTEQNSMDELSTARHFYLNHLQEQN